MKTTARSISQFIRISMVSIAFLSLCITPVLSQNISTGFENVDGDSALLAIAKTNNNIENKSDKMALPIFDITNKYENINAYLGETLVFPGEGITTGHSGLMKVQFQIQTNGHISHIQFIESPGVAFEKEVIKALMAAPKWTPAQKNSIPVQTTYQLNINFSLQ